MPRRPDRSLLIRAVVAATAVAVAALTYVVWPHVAGTSSSTVAATSSAAPTANRTTPATPGSTASASPVPAVSASASLTPTTKSASPAAVGGHGAITPTPLPKPSSLPRLAAVPWPAWKVQASTVCTSQRLSEWAAQLTSGTAGAATDPASKKYAAAQLGQGAGRFYSILSGLAVTPTDQVGQGRRADLLQTVQKVARSGGATTDTEAAWRTAASALTAEAIRC